MSPCSLAFLLIWRLYSKGERPRKRESQTKSLSPLWLRLGNHTASFRHNLLIKVVLLPLPCVPHFKGRRDRPPFDGGATGFRRTHGTRHISVTIFAKCSLPQSTIVILSSATELDVPSYCWKGQAFRPSTLCSVIARICCKWLSHWRKKDPTLIIEMVQFLAWELMFALLILWPRPEVLLRDSLFHWSLHSRLYL